MIFGYAKMAITIIMVVGIGSAVAYVYKLRADNAVLKANNVLLEQSVESQKQVIEQQKIDFEAIVQANKKIVEHNKKLEKEYGALDKKFNKINASGKKRDLGALAIKKPRPIEKIINKIIPILFAICLIMLCILRIL